MANQTPNHGLNKYELGETDWTHSPDMQALEERVPVRDVESNLGNYQPYAGAKFEAVDTETVYYGTGDTWEQAASAGKNPAMNSLWTRSTVTQSLSVRNWRVIDVSQYGFPGDGSGGDLAEFIADTCWRGGNFLFVLPEGTYRWERPLRFTGGSGEFDEPIPGQFAIVGKPEATIDVHIPSSYNPKDRTMFRFGGRNSPVPHVELHDLHVDVGHADPSRDAGIMRATIGEYMSASNISMSKRCRLNSDGSRNGDRFSYKVDVLSQNGVATHRNIDLTAGDVHVGDANSVGHAIPFASEPNHEGTNRWIGCRVAGYTDNGFYIRNYSDTGHNILEGCLSRNCGGGNIRIGRNDSVSNCRVVIDGSEAPADGCGLWIENAAGTTVDGIRIEGPAMDNDAIRVTGDIQNGSIRNAYVEQGGREYAIKATGGAEQFTFDSITIEDGADGYQRICGIYCTMDNTTFRDVTLLNRDHGGSNGRVPLCVSGENLTFDSCRFLTDAPYAVRLGSPFSGYDGEPLSVRFNHCTFENTGDATPLMKYENSPGARQLIVKNGTIDGYNELIGNGSIYDFDTVSFRDNFGYDNWE